jgi:hypothetical protein
MYSGKCGGRRIRTKLQIAFPIIAILILLLGTTISSSIYYSKEVIGNNNNYALAKTFHKTYHRTDIPRINSCGNDNVSINDLCQGIDSGVQSASFSLFTPWTKWKSEGGKFIGNVDAKLVRATDFGSILDVYGTGTDHTLQEKRQVFEGKNGQYVSENFDHGSLKSTPEYILTLSGFREFFVVGTDQQLWFLRVGNPNWISLGGNVIGNPDAILDVDQPDFSQKIFVFVLQTDKAISYKTQTGANTFTDWQSLGGNMASNPAAARNNDGRIEVFAVGIDGALYHRYQTIDGGPWNSNWESLGEKITGNTTVVKNVDGRLQVFAVRASDHSLISRTQLSPGNSQHWGKWLSIRGQTLTTDVSVASNYDGRLEAFALTKGNNLVHSAQVSTGSDRWTEWESLGRNNVVSRPTAVTNNDGRIEVFGIGPDGALKHRSQSSNLLDRDGDLIPDRWEQTGKVDINGDGITDLRLPKSNPFHKDIYLEIDYMQFHKPWDQAISDIIKAFAKAPVSNPDGRGGINLHILVDEQIPHSEFIDLNQYYFVYKPKYFGTPAERSGPNALYTIAAKDFLYHYAIFAHRYATDSRSGVSEIRGNDILITFGTPGWGIDPNTGHTVGSVDQQEGTLMHELGHNLNFDHGGVDPINCKPNYLSVMSYSRTDSSLISNRPLDYSRKALNTLDENNLNENTGIAASVPPGQTTAYGPPPLRLGTTGNGFDWNRNGIIGDVGVIADLNHIGMGNESDTTTYRFCNSTSSEVENSYNDWNRVVYNAGVNKLDSESAFVGGGNMTGANELPVEKVTAARLILLESLNAAIKDLPSKAFSTSAESQQEKNQSQQLQEPPTTPPNLPSGTKNEVTILAEQRKDTITTETAPQTSNLASLLVSDKLNESITALLGLKSKMDGSIGGNPQDDLIIDPSAQQKTVGLINNFIQSLEKQK